MGCSQVTIPKRNHQCFILFLLECRLIKISDVRVAMFLGDWICFIDIPCG